MASKRLSAVPKRPVVQTRIVRKVPQVLASGRMSKMERGRDVFSGSSGTEARGIVV